MGVMVFDGRMRRLGFIAIGLLALAVTAYAVVFYGIRPFASHVDDPVVRASLLGHKEVLRFHIFAASVALALGSFQFSQRIRARWPRVHRITGRLYLGIGVGLGGLSGVYVALTGYGGPVANAGFTMLALSWLFTGSKAFAAIRRGDVAEHRRWMVRNWSLTLSAVTLRLYALLAGALGVDVAVAYPVIAWLGWVPNLALAQLILLRERRVATTSGFLAPGPR